ncbi:hypothetical protein X805_14930 [Sphaerotilus natans subsp. natans DSM 6575]|uniref:TIGR02677 family protein n=1 Tax=Sphaerotilus natans subsp. natans DSM 6575 TaxID=1286631 RepID=A0A059KNT2_9BURK|nr:TIGR02677 family protein [Sphaerotilus natans]KDB52889.1 hypothetical protein X805_14930 [Sphaerotilus natans subsp. natans DSM 6575]SIS05338.1 TIGR02677 family protein [Sphaerotilus natans]
MLTTSDHDLFRHLGADKADLYRRILAVFAAALRQYQLQLRPDEVLAQGEWAAGAVPRIEDIQAALTQLSAWGNLEAQPDMARVSSLNDYYRARFLYRLSAGGEAVEAALDVFAASLQRRAELQTVALEDITMRLQALCRLAAEGREGAVLDAAKVHETLRDLAQRFEEMTRNAQHFMAGVARQLDLRQADATAVVQYKRRLIDYLERFLGDLVRRSGTIAAHLSALESDIDSLLHAVATREARDAAPDATTDLAADRLARHQVWQGRWRGLRSWFLRQGDTPPQAELLRARARSAIPQLLGAIAALNERRSGRSDRAADFRLLAGWFADCEDDAQSHRLARAAFALHPARHLAMTVSFDAPLPASTPWHQAPPLAIQPRLRELGEAAPRGVAPPVHDRVAAREHIARQLAEESRQIEAARQRLATGQVLRLSELSAERPLEGESLDLLLSLLGEALAEQADPDQPVERLSGDGLMRIRLEPLAADSHAEIVSARGVLGGRDHLVTITPA